MEIPFLSDGETEPPWLVKKRGTAPGRTCPWIILDTLGQTMVKPVKAEVETTSLGDLYGRSRLWWWGLLQEGCDAGVWDMGSDLLMLESTAWHAMEGYI